MELSRLSTLQATSSIENTASNSSLMSEKRDRDLHISFATLLRLCPWSRDVRRLKDDVLQLGKTACKDRANQYALRQTTCPIPR